MVISLLIFGPWEHIVKRIKIRQPLLISWHFVIELSASIGTLIFPGFFFHLQFHSIVSLASQFLSHVSDSVAICYSVMAKCEQQANQHEWIVVTNRFHSGSIFINNWLINIVSSHRCIFRRGWHYRLQLFFLLWLKLSHIRTTKSRLIKWFFAHSKRGFKGQHIVQDSSLLIDRSYCADAVKPLLSSDNWQSSKTLNWCFFILY